MNKEDMKMIVLLYVLVNISKINLYEQKKIFLFAFDSFLIVSPTSQSTRNMKWLKEHVPEDGSVFLSDVTSLYTALNVIGPKAKYLLAELSDENFNDFARMTCQEIDVGFVSHIYAMRLTHTGEDGFMLYIPSEVKLIYTLYFSDVNVCFFSSMLCVFMIY